MKKSYLFIVIVILAVFAWLALKPQTLESKPHISQVEIAGKTLNVELADTDIKRELGLSGHAPLAENQGMLFIFEKSGIYPFWMKDMLFPIDIIWISDDFQVVYIEKNAQPSSYPKTFGPNENAKYVLEINAGFSEKNNLKIGDELKFLR